MGSAVSVEHVSKHFRIFHERNQSLKAVVLRGARSAYEDFLALDDVHFEVPEGSTFGVIGENGSGKSTLLKCMARILYPDSGTITTRGRTSALLELGAGFHPELSGRENVFLNGSILGMSRRELSRKFDDIVGFAGLERFIDTPVKNYSSGMYVRLGFSVAINVDPDILLVDEVLAVGDESFQRRCTEKFGELKAGGKTIVLVTHSLGAVRNLCDRAVSLEHGRMVQVGPAAAVVDEYMGSVSGGTQDDSGEIRWGTGEAVIQSLELLDKTGAPTTRARTGDSVTFRLRYRSPDPIDKPVFAFGVFSLEGIHLIGPNMRDNDQFPERIHGTGQVTFAVDRLLLVPGSYILSASITDYGGDHHYDVRYGVVHLNVDVGEPRESVGFVSLPGKWQIVSDDGEPSLGG
ncbi:MAG: ABC transporter ATP-binding protein [Actinomycetota bacterium]|nr:ABC transporter ATP-binding protein [Actinomycetota bacterium]